MLHVSLSQYVVVVGVAVAALGAAVSNMICAAETLQVCTPVAFNGIGVLNESFHHGFSLLIVPPESTTCQRCSVFALTALRFDLA